MEDGSKFIWMKNPEDCLFRWEVEGRKDDLVVRVPAWNSEDLGQFLALLQPSCMSLDKSLSFSVPYFSTHKPEITALIYLTGVLGG